MTAAEGAQHRVEVVPPRSRSRTDPARARPGGRAAIVARPHAPIAAHDPGAAGPDADPRCSVCSRRQWMSAERAGAPVVHQEQIALEQQGAEDPAVLHARADGRVPGPPSTATSGGLLAGPVLGGQPAKADPHVRAGRARGIESAADLSAHPACAVRAGPEHQGAHLHALGRRGSRASPERESGADQKRGEQTSAHVPVVSPTAPGPRAGYVSRRRPVTECPGLTPA